MTFVLGLTGSIGMGKSATADLFRRLGVPVHDADATVHRLYRGRAAPLIAKTFPGTVTDGAVDRARLGAAVLNDPERMKQLEAIVHPLVREEEEAFLKRVSALSPVAVLDIPLLFETGGCAARPRHGPARHDGGEISCHPGQADEGRGQARPCPFSRRYQPRFRFRRSSGEVHSCVSRRPAGRTPPFLMKSFRNVA
jgi:dephospho-CoA kinase